MNKNLTTLERLQAPTPKYFKTIQVVSVIIATLSATIVGLQENLTAAGLGVPEIVVTFSKWLGVISATIAAVSQLTVDWDAFKMKNALKDL